MESVKGNQSRLRTSVKPLPNNQCKQQHLDKAELQCIVLFRVADNNRDSHPLKAKLWTTSAQTNPSYVSLQTAYLPLKSYRRILAFLLRWWLNLSVNCPLAKKSLLLLLQTSRSCGVVNVVPTWTPLSSSLIMDQGGFATFADLITKLMVITTLRWINKRDSAWT